MSAFEAAEQEAQDAANCLRMTLRQLHGAVAMVREAHAAVDRWKGTLDTANGKLPEARRVPVLDVYAEALPVERSAYPMLSEAGARTDALLMTVGAMVEG